MLAVAVIYYLAQVMIQCRNGSGRQQRGTVVVLGTTPLRPWIADPINMRVTADTGTYTKTLNVHDALSPLDRHRYVTGGTTHTTGHNQIDLSPFAR